MDVVVNEADSGADGYSGMEDLTIEVSEANYDEITDFEQVVEDDVVVTSSL